MLKVPSSALELVSVDGSVGTASVISKGSASQLRKWMQAATKESTPVRELVVSIHSDESVVLDVLCRSGVGDAGPALEKISFSLFTGDGVYFWTCVGEGLAKRGARSLRTISLTVDYWKTGPVGCLSSINALFTGIRDHGLVRRLELDFSETDIAVNQANKLVNELSKTFLGQASCPLDAIKLVFPLGLTSPSLRTFSSALAVSRVKDIECRFVFRYPATNMYNGLRRNRTVKALRLGCYFDVDCKSAEWVPGIPAQLEELDLESANIECLDALVTRANVKLHAFNDLHTLTLNAVANSPTNENHVPAWTAPESQWRQLLQALPAVRKLSIQHWGALGKPLADGTLSPPDPATVSAYETGMAAVLSAAADVAASGSSKLVEVDASGSHLGPGCAAAVTKARAALQTLRLDPEQVPRLGLPSETALLTATPSSSSPPPFFCP